MSAMFKRKGITPVIAIVLLLLITVGAVTVVYSQFQSLTEGNEAEQQLEDQQAVQRASYDIIGVKSTDPNNPGDGTIEITVKNTGDEVLDLNTRATISIGKDGETPQAISVLNSDAECQLGTIQSGSSQSCDTGISWPTPDDGQSTTIRLSIGEVVKDSYTCTAESGSRFC